MSQITTHILDTSLGKPAASVPITLEFRQPDGSWLPVGADATNEDGRAKNLLPDDRKLAGGVYKLTFDVQTYFSGFAHESFFPLVEIQFRVEDSGEHYHVPLLLNPFGYSTYRGS